MSDSPASTAVKRGARAESPKPTEKKDETGAKGEEKVEEKAKGGLFSPRNLAILAVVAAVLFGLFKQYGDQVDIKGGLEKAIVFVEAQGTTAVAWYVLFTFIGVVCLIPTTPMELAGGFLFSPTYGVWTVLAFTGAAKLAANIISVLVARFIVKDWVVRNVVAKSELLTMVSSAVKDEPWKMAFLVRGAMVPLFVKNYGLGVMDIDYLPIAVCSSFFTNFYAFQNIYMGSACENLKEVFSPKKAAVGPTDWMATMKKMMPVAFNIMLVIFLIKAVKDQIKKQKTQIQEKLEKEAAAKTAGEKKAE